jgi:probable phosphoglycerate mutase
LNLAAIFLTRHCKTAWNLENKLQGSIDLPLCEKGRLEALSLLSTMERFGFDRIVSSPYQRALQTARIYAEHLDVPLETHARLRELDHGAWEGQKIEDLLNADDSGYQQWLDDAASIEIPSGSETMEMAQQRVVQAVVEIADGYRNEKILVVLHKHIRALLCCRLDDVDISLFGKQIDESVAPAEVTSAQLGRLSSNFVSCS